MTLPRRRPLICVCPLTYKGWRELGSSNMIQCPNDEQLAGYTAGVSGGDDARRIHAHVSGCPRCKRWLADADANDAMLDSVRQALTNADRLDFNRLLPPQPDSQGETVERPLTARHPKRAAPVVEREEDVTEVTPTRARAAEHFPRIEGYRILDILGRGGMGIVYRAVQIKLNRTVALKVLPAIISSTSTSAVSRFRREATSAARLHHTNIIPVYDFGEAHDVYYYAMELIKGQPLNVVIHRLAEEGALTGSPTRLGALLRAAVTAPQADQPPEAVGPAGEVDDSVWREATSTHRGGVYYRQVARWMADAADAMHYAHGEDIIHRDIKPGNLVLSIDGRIMIADFGLAKGSGDRSITMTGSLVGTLRYMSPEQAMAKRVRVDHRTDIYSLGATMYELLTLKPVFVGADDKEVLGQIIAHDPVAPHKVAPGVPPELETICLKSLEKAPDERYATAGALAEDLRRYISDLPIVAKRPGPIGRTLKFVRRHKASLAAMAATSLLTVSIVLAVVGVNSRNARLRQSREWTRYGIELNEMNRWYEAIGVFERVLEANPDNAQALFELARTKKSLANNLAAPADVRKVLEEADLLCRRALLIAPEDANGLNTHGVILKKLGHYARAIEAYQEVIRIDPEYFPPWVNLGTIHALTGDFERAEEELLHATELVEADDEVKRYAYGAQAWRNLASLQFVLGRAEALESIEHALRRNPDDVPSLVLSARLRLAGNREVDLQEALDDAIFADRIAGGGDPRAKRLRALAHLRNGNYVEAIRHASVANALKDLPAINHLIMAIADAHLGNDAESSEHLSDAIESWPEMLQDDGAQQISADKGVLWSESASELLALRKEAERLIGLGNP